MNLSELTDKIVDTHPAIPSAMAAQVLRTALRTIREQIENLPEGTVSVPLLGQFRIKRVELERDGTKSQVRRTVFIAPRVKPNAEFPALAPARATASAK